jgi:glycerol-3-phosphate dehydrogenase
MAADHDQPAVDVFVIGGGVNGCGVARDAAGRGYSVRLAEMGDLASGASSRSTKLIHGGLRYLEYLEFRLVREALREREILLANAPHLVRPLRFVLPYQRGLRPFWMLRLGLFLYDHIGGRKRLPPTRSLDLRRDGAGAPLKPEFVKGFEYSDCWVDDARLVVLNARDAANRGATIETRKKVVGAHARNGKWIVSLRDLVTSEESEVVARVLVNAAGPWVERVFSGIAPHDNDHVRLVKGSHIVMPKIFDHQRCYIFQNPDGRIIFAIPYETDFILIGTTDQDYVGDPAESAITPQEIDYLCAAASDYFIQPISSAAVVWAYSGVRPLYGDPAVAAQDATRDYVIKLEAVNNAPLINIFGGKITTYRRLAEKILESIGEKIGVRGAQWTALAPLPGGDFLNGDIDAFTRHLRARKPFLNEALARRLARSYGSLCLEFLAGAQSLADLGPDFGAGLTRAEIDYLVEREWALTAEDILWRRTKLGLRSPPSAAAEIDAYLALRRESALGRTK